MKLTSIKTKSIFLVFFIFYTFLRRKESFFSLKIRKVKSILNLLNKSLNSTLSFYIFILISFTGD